MIKNKEIIPGKGVGNIQLGMNQGEIEKVLGKPDDIDKMEYDDGEYSISWFYYDFELELAFESLDNERLSFISIEGESYAIQNKIRIGQTQEDVLKACKDLSFSKPIVEDLSDDETPNQILISLDKENINFWFLDGVLDEIQIGPFWEDDENVIWPN